MLWLGEKIRNYKWVTGEVVIRFFKGFSRYYNRISNAQVVEIEKFVEFAAGQVKPSDTILDAGSGNQRYKGYFSHTNYESTDIEQALGAEHDFVCSLDDIPRPDNTYDAILCTQVFEHVEFPQRVINELYRVLKPGGKFFVSVPQGAALHGAPYHFYNFTEYGLRSLFKEAGFEVESISHHGGGFWDLSKRMQTLPRYISKQYKDPANADKISASDRFYWAILAPIRFILKPLYKYVLPIIFYYLDTLDKERSCTLGYSCYCIKPTAQGN